MNLNKKKLFNIKKLIIIGIVFFYLNDFVLIFLKAKNSWLVFGFDWVSRLGLILILIRLGGLSWSAGDFAIKNLTVKNHEWVKRPVPYLLVDTVFLSIGCVFIERVCHFYIEQNIHWGEFFSFPLYSGFMQRCIDLSFGLGLVALSEEFIFRYLIVKHLMCLDRFRVSTIVFIQAALFAGAHWSVGVGNVISAFLWAILPGLYFARIGALWPLVIAHFVTDFVAFF